MPDDELLERVRELRARGGSAKEIARDFQFDVPVMYLHRPHSGPVPERSDVRHPGFDHEAATGPQVTRGVAEARHLRFLRRERIDGIDGEDSQCEVAACRYLREVADDNWYVRTPLLAPKQGGHLG
jgi:hypothetical protein